MSKDVNIIKEIYPGHFGVKLDFPDQTIIKSLLSREYRYVWVYNHKEVQTQWREYDYEIYGKKSYKKEVKVRNMNFEFLMETTDFIEISEEISQPLYLIQLNNFPPPYISLNKLKGKARYDLFANKLQYYFEIDLPKASDFGYIVSDNVDILNKAIAFC
jgi:hypothetical protein